MSTRREALGALLLPLLPGACAPHGAAPRSPAPPPAEGLQICQMGFDLARGDEVLATTQDYPRMLTTFKQRERREGIVLRSPSSSTALTRLPSSTRFCTAVERVIRNGTL